MIKLAALFSLALTGEIEKNPTPFDAEPITKDDIVYFDPEMEPQKGSSVSEWGWALIKLNDVCIRTNGDPMMDDFCEEIDAIVNPSNEDTVENECFPIADPLGIPPYITDCGMTKAKGVTYAIKYHFTQLAGEPYQCGNHECYDIAYMKYTWGINIARFAFPSYEMP